MFNQPLRMIDKELAIIIREAECARAYDDYVTGWPTYYKKISPSAIWQAGFNRGWIAATNQKEIQNVQKTNKSYY